MATVNKKNAAGDGAGGNGKADDNKFGMDGDFLLSVSNHTTKTPIYQDKDFHLLVCQSGPIGYAVEDTIFTLKNLLDELDILSKEDERWNNLIFRTWLKMATNARYLPENIRTWGYQFDYLFLDGE